ncbi:MAG: hypothetical protein E7624_02025 [Ruminococcaceae bacterium]|nr:hypothetical protein [Oscillospiraceae bacterium]
MKKAKKHIALILAILILFSALSALTISVSASYMPPTNETSITGGSFYIQNADSLKYMQIDNDEEPSYSASGAITELWGYDGEDQQRWRINKLSGPYYQIICEKSGLALSVQEDCLDDSGDSLIQEPYVNSHRQQWTITKTTRGTYVIRPRSSESYSTDWCMCAGTSFFGITDGLDVEQKEYSNDSSLKDEWYLYNTYITTLLAINDSDGWSRDPYFTPTSRYFTNWVSSSIYTETYSSYTVQNMIQCMQRSSIFYIHTHGSRTSFKISNSPISITTNDLANIDLSHMEFALLLTCNTGEGGYNQANVNAKTPQNMVERLVCCGVETVIGFSASTYVVDCNWFAENFTRLMLETDTTICQAIRTLSLNATYGEIAYLAVVGGNTAYQFI